MKHRLAKQIEEINEFLGIFRSSKSKCGRFLAKLDLDMQQIQEYDKIEKLFKIDLNILDLNHLRDRKSKLVKAIDELTKLQSELNLKIIKQAEKDQAEFEQFSQHQIEDSLIVEENDDKQFEPQILTHIDAIKINTNENRRISHKRRSAECEVKTSRCGQLYNIWSKNRPQPNQNVQDKFDRLSKIIGILKKNAKEIYEQEKQRNDNLILQDSDEYNEIKQELYNLKQQNINLKNINTQLFEQNSTLKQSNKLQTKEQSINKAVFETKDTQTDHESQQNLIVCENFSRIINIYNPETEYSIDGSRLYRKHDELQCQSLIKNSELSDSIIQDFSNRRLRTNSEQDPAESSLEQSTFGILTFNKRVMNENEVTKQAGVKQLQSVENKLKEIKQNRKRISNDDDLWSQMENMQL